MLQKLTGSTTRAITLAFGAAVALLVVVGAVATLAAKRLLRDTDWVAHSYEVRSGLRSVGDALNDGKAAVRGYLLTGDIEYAVATRAAVDSARRSSDRVATLVADNPAQTRRARDLRDRITARADAFRQTLNLRTALDSGRTTAELGSLQRPSPALRYHLDVGERLSTDIAQRLAGLDSTEQALLRRRLTAQHDAQRVVVGLVVLLAGAVALVAFLALRTLRRDLQKREATEAQLRASEAKFAGILSLGADAIITVDHRRLIVHFNQTAERIFGYAAAEVIGQPIEVLLPARFVHAHRGYVEEFARGPVTARRMGHRRPVAGRRKTGEEFPADASISKLDTPDGVLFTVILRDITEQRLQERHATLLADAGALLGTTVELEQASRAAVQAAVPVLADWAVLDLVDEAGSDGPHIHRRVSSHAAAGLEAALRGLEAEGLSEDAPDYCLDVLRRGQVEQVAPVTPAWLEAHSCGDAQLAHLRALGPRALLYLPLRAHDQLLGVLTLGRSTLPVPEDAELARKTVAPAGPFSAEDVALATALADRIADALAMARLYEAAQRATAARDDVLGVVSHDLRGPLASISMCAGVLAGGTLPPEMGAPQLGTTILDSARLMERMIRDLLDVASIEQGRLRLERQPMPVAPLLAQMREMYDRRAQDQGVTLQVAIAPELPLILADGARLLQVLTNLVGNALKYTPAGGTIAVRAAARLGEVLLSVQDSGSGIPAEDLPHIFERYWHARRGSKQSGTGLGLAIAQGIVTAHGGRLWVESEFGRGSMFWLTVPAALARTALPGRASPDEPAATAADAASEARELHGRRAGHSRRA